MSVIPLIWSAKVSSRFHLNALGMPTIFLFFFFSLTVGLALPALKVHVRIACQLNVAGPSDWQRVRVPLSRRWQSRTRQLAAGFFFCFWDFEAQLGGTLGRAASGQCEWASH